jgi:hypothetical protein
MSKNMLKALSVLTNRAKAFGADHLLGFRDYYKIFHYIKNPHFDDYYKIYKRGGIGFRALTAYPRATYSTLPGLETTNGAVSPLQKNWQLLEDKLAITQYMERLDIGSSIGNYALMFIGVPGKPEAPTTSANIDDVKYIKIILQCNVTQVIKDTNSESDRFGLPEFYHLKIDASASTSLKVHHSRIIHCAGTVLDDELEGQPFLAPALNYLTDLEKILGSSAEAYFLQCKSVLHLDVDTDVDLDDEAKKALRDETDDLINGISRVMRTQGVNAKNLSGSPTDPRGAFITQVQAIGGTLGIPSRVLIGSESGKLASVQDSENWKDRVRERRTSESEPLLLKPVIKFFQSVGILADSKYKIVWPEPVLPFEQRVANAEKASKTLLNVVKQYKEAGVTPEVVVGVDEFRAEYLGLRARPDFKENEGYQGDPEKMVATIPEVDDLEIDGTQSTDSPEEVIE